jgi:uncharacterized protein (TIGR00106 family)
VHGAVIYSWHRAAHSLRAGSVRSSANTEEYIQMLVAFSITPLGIGEDVGRAVAEAVRVVRASGLPNRTDPMFTTIEGEWDDVIPLIKTAVDAVGRLAPRVGLTLKADIRPGVENAITAKVEAIERHLADS